jgi:alkylation response protein AidB-like acyl-CoA dehydrogenase
MSFLLNEEQGLLRESALSFISEQSPVGLQRTLRDSANPLGFSTELWDQAIELGWTAAVLPEDVGGLEVGYAGLGAVFEVMGRQLAALPMLSHTVLAGEILIRCEPDEYRAQRLEQLITGKSRMAVAIDESQHHLPSTLNATATPIANVGWLLNGDKWFVMDGVGAQTLLVLAKMADTQALGLFWVDTGLAGVEVQSLRMADSRNHARVTLKDVEVAESQRLSLGHVSDALDQALDRARVCLAAEGLGIVRETFERTVAYLKERVQFDVPIGSFQALQHRMARLYTEIELLDSCVKAALSAIDTNSHDLPALASLAKAKSADLCEKALNEAVQLHGGIGVTDEFDLGLFLKRARVIQQSLGDATFHRNRYAECKGF